MISVALLLGTPGLAKADPDTMAKLIADVAQANQRLEDLNAQIQTEEESVNKAVVDVETARDNATAAQHDVEASRQSVKNADAAIAVAQKRLRQRAVGRLPHGGQPRRHDRDRGRRSDAGRQLAAGDGQPATGPHRAVEQGFDRPAGQAEGR
jgi:multidrug resistance efflux pump